MMRDMMYSSSCELDHDGVSAWTNDMMELNIHRTSNDMNDMKINCYK